VIADPSSQSQSRTVDGQAAKDEHRRVQTSDFCPERLTELGSESSEQEATNSYSSVSVHPKSVTVAKAQFVN
jgi:hypothetical protein